MVCLFYLLEGFTRFRLLEMSSDLGVVLCDDDDTVGMAISWRSEHVFQGIISDCFWVWEMCSLHQLLCHISNREVDGRMLFVKNLAWKVLQVSKHSDTRCRLRHKFQVNCLIKLEDSWLIWHNRMEATYLHKHQIWEVYEGHGTLTLIDKGLIILILYSSNISVCLSQKNQLFSLCR